MTQCTNNSKYTNELIDELIQKNLPMALAMENDFEKGVAIYGAGFVGSWAAPYLNSLGAKVTYYIDRDCNKEGSKICDIPVITPDNDKVKEVSSMFIAARHAITDVTNNFKDKNMNLLSFDGYYVIKNYKKFTEVRDNFFHDQKSIETYNALLFSMLTGTIGSCLEVMEKDMYFALPEFSGSFDDIFVDAGAFVGDTVERFIWENLGTFKHIYAFEPGEKQFKALDIRMNRLYDEWAIDKKQVTLIKGGLSDKEDIMTCSYVDDSPLRHGLNPISSNNDNSNQTKVYALDNYLEGKPVSFIKADVEGMEMALLRGAKKTIQTHKPKMALCVYHYPSDLFEIAEYVRELDSDYKFCLKQHAPIFGDFVLYCYI